MLITIVSLTYQIYQGKDFTCKTNQSKTEQNREQSNELINIISKKKRMKIQTFYKLNKKQYILSYLVSIFYNVY